MIVKLNVIDRLFIGNFLPVREGILVQVMARDIGKKIELTEKDRKAVNMRPSPKGGLSWDIENIEKTETDIDFSEAEIRMLQDQVDKLDKAKDITSSMLDTALKIRDIKIEKKPPKK